MYENRAEGEDVKFIERTSLVAQYFKLYSAYIVTI